MLRVALAFAGALLCAVIVGRPFLYALRRLRLGQFIREEGPQSHRKKAGTPTMGGIIILTAASIVLLAMGCVKGPVKWAFIITWGFGLLGLLDDVLKVAGKRNMGLKARQKLLGQAVMAGILSLYAVHEGLGADLPLPFLSLTINLSPILLFALSTFAVVAISNGVNLADGLDGLAAGLVAWTALSQTGLAMIYGPPEMAVFTAAMAGGCLGFLWFNAHPAAVFMGDTGALALGASLGAAVILTRTTFFLPVTAGVFVLELISDILQVVFFQLFHRRVFRMAPLHHHFELGGWPEEKVVVRFWLAGILFGLGGVFGALLF